VLFVLDAFQKHIDKCVHVALDRLKSIQQLNPSLEVALVVNKVDRVDGDFYKQRLFNQLKTLSENFEFSKVFFVSALHGTNVNEVQEYLTQKSRPGKWQHDPSKKSTLNEEKLALEVLREQIFKTMYQEIPYQIKSELTGWTTLENGTLRVDVALHVERPSLVKLIRGSKDYRIRELESQAATVMSNLLSRQVTYRIEPKLRRFSAIPHV